MNLKPLKVDQFAAETRVKMMTEMVEWLAGMGFTHLATFNFNAKATPTSIRTALKRFQWRCLLDLPSNTTGSKVIISQAICGGSPQMFSWF